MVVQRTSRSNNVDLKHEATPEFSDAILSSRPSNAVIKEELCVPAVPLNNDGFTYTLAIAEQAAIKSEEAQLFHPFSLPLLNHLSPTDRN